MGEVTIGEAFTSTFGLVWKNLGTFLKTQGVIVLLVGLPTAFCMVLLSREVTLRFPTQAQPEVDVFGAFTPRILALYALVIAATGIGSLFIHSVGLVVARRLLQGAAKPTLAEALRAAAPRIPNLLATWLIIFGIVLAILAVPVAVFVAGVVGRHWPLLLLGFFLVFAGIVVAFLLGLRWLLVSAISVYEASAPLANLARARDLTRGRLATVFFSIFLITLVGALAAAAITMPFSLWRLGEIATQGPGQPPSFGSLVLSSIGQLVTQLFVAPLGTAVVAVLYVRITAPPPAAPGFIPLDAPYLPRSEPPGNP